MNKLFYLSIIFITLFSCTNAIKNKDAKVEEEEGTQANTLAVPEEMVKAVEKETASDQGAVDSEDPIGFWVGFFEQDAEKMGEEKVMFLDEGYYWNRNNKINISIDELRDTIAIGHSVVAGNDRPFRGTVVKTVNLNDQSVIYSFKVREPGNDRYDGEFTFRIVNGKMTGTWEAYRDINIKYRKYTLEKKVFRYDPNVELEYAKSYVDWEKASTTKHYEEQDGDETYEWFTQQFASATDAIYKINASNTLLTNADVENLKRGDLTIIRNTIYARHGYSFKNQPLRVFFDAQSWYIPVYADIRNDFTEIELKNIKLLLSFEKNAAEYYDSFGRG